MSSTTGDDRDAPGGANATGAGAAPAVQRAARLGDLKLAEHPWDVYARLVSWKELQTREQKPYLVLELADCDDVCEAKIWADAAEAMAAVKQMPPQSIVKARGRVREYQGRCQLIVDRIRIVDAEDDAFDPAQIEDPALQLVEDLVCRTLVVDIETVPAVDRRQLPATVQEALTNYATRKDMEPGAVMGLSPFFGKVVSLAIGDGDVEPGPREDGDRDAAEVTVLAVPPEGREIADVPPWLRLMSERDLLAAFWALAAKAEVVVTFNGRGFDIPFLVTRSVIHGIPARRDLVSSRFSLKPHLDLWELLSQRGGPSKLDVVCWALGIESPKEQMDGSMVAPAYERGEIVEIARYNAHDVRATSAVFRKVRDLVLRYRSDW